MHNYNTKRLILKRKKNQEEPIPKQERAKALLDKRRTMHQKKAKNVSKVTPLSPEESTKEQLKTQQKEIENLKKELDLARINQSKVRLEMNNLKRVNKQLKKENSQKTQRIAILSGTKKSQDRDLKTAYHLALSEKAQQKRELDRLYLRTGYASIDQLIEHFETCHLDGEEVSTMRKKVRQQEAQIQSLKERLDREVTKVKFSVPNANQIAMSTYMKLKKKHDELGINFHKMQVKYQQVRAENADMVQKYGLLTKEHMIYRNAQELLDSFMKRINEGNIVTYRNLLEKYLAKALEMEEEFLNTYWVDVKYGQVQYFGPDIIFKENGTDYLTIVGRDKSTFDGLRQINNHAFISIEVDEEGKFIDVIDIYAGYGQILEASEANKERKIKRNRKQVSQEARLRPIMDMIEHEDHKLDRLRKLDAEMYSEAELLEHSLAFLERVKDYKEIALIGMSKRNKGLHQTLKDRFGMDNVVLYDVFEANEKQVLSRLKAADLTFLDTSAISHAFIYAVMADMGPDDQRLLYLDDNLVLGLDQIPWEAKSIFIKHGFRQQDLLTYLYYKSREQEASDVGTVPPIEGPYQTPLLQRIEGDKPVETAGD